MNLRRTPLALKMLTRVTLVHPLEDEVHAGAHHHIFFAQSEIGVHGCPLQPQKGNRNAERRTNRRKVKAMLEEEAATVGQPFWLGQMPGFAQTEHASQSAQIESASLSRRGPAWASPP